MGTEIHIQDLIVALTEDEMALRALFQEADHPEEIDYSLSDAREIFR